MVGFRLLKKLLLETLAAKLIQYDSSIVAK
jgi:hypothetical protein